MASHINSDKPMQECFSRAVVAEQGIPVDSEEVAGGGGRGAHAHGGGGGLEAEEGVEPRLYRVPGAVSDGFFEFYLWNEVTVIRPFFILLLKHNLHSFLKVFRCCDRCILSILFNGTLIIFVGAWLQ